MSDKDTATLNAYKKANQAYHQSITKTEAAQNAARQQAVVDAEAKRQREAEEAARRAEPGALPATASGGLQRSLNKVTDELYPETPKSMAERLQEALEHHDGVMEANRIKMRDVI